MSAATATLPTTLDFQETAIEIHDHNGQPWVLSQQVAKALGYQRADSVNKIYERNKDEFTVDMTTNVKLTYVKDDNRLHRIFSPRGCHLVAMFARTEKAKAFRRWVLDVLDKVGADTPTALPSPYLTPEQKHNIQKLITRYVYSTEPKDHYPFLFKRFYRDRRQWQWMKRNILIPTATKGL